MSKLKKILNVMISPSFSNNRLQSYIKSYVEKEYLFQVTFKNPLTLINGYKENEKIEKMEIEDQILEDILSIDNTQSEVKSSNMIGFENPDNNKKPFIFLIFDSLKIQEILIRTEQIQSLNADITLIIISTKENELQIQLKFFLEIQYKIKTFFCENNEMFFKYFENVLKTIPVKNEKSKIEYYENKSGVQLKTYFNEEFEDENTPTFIRQLTCIPGVSEIKAHAIAIKYSFKNLIKYYTDQSTSQKEKELLLKDIQINSKLAKTTRIGEAISKKVYFFYTSESSSIIN